MCGAQGEGRVQDSRGSSCGRGVSRGEAGEKTTDQRVGKSGKKKGEKNRLALNRGNDIRRKKRGVTVSVTRATTQNGAEREKTSSSGRGVDEQGTSGFEEQEKKKKGWSKGSRSVGAR